MSFWRLSLPDDDSAYVPDDIRVILPADLDIPMRRLHLLAYIPWDNRYKSYIPSEYRDFFRYVLPYLGARTTDVHTALSVSMLPELIAGTDSPIDEAVVYSAVILHDAGWAQLSPKQIADSLDYSALAYSDIAQKPKELHTTLGSQVAEKLLRGYKGSAPSLNIDQRKLITRLVYYHDLQVRPWPTRPEPTEYLLVVDADRLWSYTHENFWLDTVRKNTTPIQYVQELENSIDTYFVTPQGNATAHRLIADRKREVSSLPPEERQLQK